MKRADIDNSILELAKDAERKLKRLKMAKFSIDLFDEIISEMMRDKKTIMEMLAELDCDEE
jgi:c-di-AMP phosphodiesterase-like protein